MNQLEQPIRMNVIQLRNPVVALIQYLAARCSLRIDSSVGRHGTLEGCSTGHDVDMARGNSRADNRVGALNSERAAVGCELVCEYLAEDKMRDREEQRSKKSWGDKIHV
jgi:hypothetical protein